MPRRNIHDVGEELASAFAGLPLSIDTDNHVMEIIAKLTHSVYKSAEDPNRGDFAKGREQMAMHAIALLVGAKNWKQVERILFDEETDADRTMLTDFNVEDSDGH